MKRKLKNAKINLKRLIKKNKHFSRRSDIEKWFKKNKHNKIYISIFLSLSIAYFIVAGYIIMNHSFSGWNYALTSILILINLIISLSISVTVRDNNKNIIEKIDNAMRDNFSEEERKQFLRLKKLKNINS